IKQTAQSKLAYFYAALMDQFCTALDSQEATGRGLPGKDGGRDGSPPYPQRNAKSQFKYHSLSQLVASPTFAALKRQFLETQFFVSLRLKAAVVDPTPNLEPNESKGV
ncbi:hypothetical protein, partial [Tritonibacter mobilis]|uniref:hypothetical protein n=1 Tax=Tritonibacter mobilis TaxID=379347 RepID=UPI001981B597